MKKIRTFIVGSSLFLFAWLAASYTHEFDQTDANAAAVESATASVPVVAIPATEPTKDQLPATASLIGSN